jgi:hypothetical protein
MTLPIWKLHSGDDRMINECGTDAWMTNSRENQSIWRKPAPRPLLVLDLGSIPGRTTFIHRNRTHSSLSAPAVNMCLQAVPTAMNPKLASRVVGTVASQNSHAAL